MSSEELEALWNDPKNYKGNYAVYVCKEDPRIVVPKRQRWAGWTLNFAHKAAFGVLITLLGFVVLPPLFAGFIWPRTELSIVVALLLGGVGVVVFCVFLDKRLGGR